LAIPGVSTPYCAFWILAHSDGPMFHLLWLFCSNILLYLHCCSGRVSVGRSHTHFYVVEHCSRIVLKASDEFQPLTHLPTREIGSLLFVPPWCTVFTLLLANMASWTIFISTILTIPQYHLWECGAMCSLVEVYWHFRATLVNFYQAT
jgi:hypothetical protein